MELRRLRQRTLDAPCWITLQSNAPVIAITMGDAAGVGPEIIVKAFAHRSQPVEYSALVVGDAERLRTANRIVGSNLRVNAIQNASEARFNPGTIDCLDLPLIPVDLPFGRISRESGDAAFQFLARAIPLALQGHLDAICTAPLNKEALHLGGHHYPGHTEILAELTGTPEVSLMLFGPSLRVIHVTAHIGLVAAISRIDAALIERTITRGRALVPVMGGEPRIGVCGINPHAGENGLFGDGEEEEKIVPAIRHCLEKGWDVTGPLPADSLFYRAARGDFDLVVAMYHDQGHGPFKVLGIEKGVNVTAGLPIIRTSVDHGTAFDIAGTGRADEGSLLEALKLAAILKRRADAERSGSTASGV
jgi:4-phospho-D-threonate 3-dehydrogenase / 4-phospho-D-erythronate 3-dehydrogenase